MTGKHCNQAMRFVLGHSEPRMRKGEKREKPGGKERERGRPRQRGV